jgi:parallel beta-helix repeat protein
LSYANEGNISNNIITNSDNGDGIQLDHCNDLTVKNNQINNNKMYGINLIHSGDINIQSNEIQNNQKGIYISPSSNNNVIYDNIITGNNKEGVLIIQSSNNILYRNDFINNGPNAQDSSTNNWYYGLQGNYWDDYTGTDSDSDGIGDTPYDIPDGSNQDIYPLGYFITETPVAYIDSISPNPATEGQTVSFNGRGTPDGAITGWEWWSSKDGVICDSSEDFSSSSLSVGTHTIKFRVKDDDQWSEYAETTLVINPQSSDDDDTGGQKPTATIVKPSTSATVTANQGESVEFQGYGMPSEGMILEYIWRSNKDGTIGTTSSFTKSSLSVGIHTIYFKVRDINDWSDEVSSNLVILEGSGTKPTNNAPTADAGGPYNGYEGFTIVFDGSGSTDDTTITTYEWDFGNGETGSGYKLSHIYTTSGDYTVTLTVTDDSGLSHTDTTTATITSEDNTNNNDDTTDDNGTPGFEIIPIFLAIIILLFWKKTNK